MTAARLALLGQGLLVPVLVLAYCEPDVALLEAAGPGLGLAGVTPWLARLQIRFAIRTRLRNLTARLIHSRPFARLRSLPAGLSVELVLDGMRAVTRVMCASAPGGRLVEVDGVVAGVMPATPEVALLNNAVYANPDALGGALEDLARVYDAAGVVGWSVWVPAADRRARRLLKRAGHRHVTSPMAMACELEGIQRPPQSALEAWTPAGDPAVMTALCDGVFGLGTALSRAFSGPLPDSARVYVAWLDGEPASSLLTCDHDGNCVVEWVATVPEARRRGLSTALLRHAMADAAGRGCMTSTLTASSAGRHGYKRLGYRDLGPIEQWERHCGKDRDPRAR